MKNCIFIFLLLAVATPRAGSAQNSEYSYNWDGHSYQVTDLPRAVIHTVVHFNRPDKGVYGRFLAYENSARTRPLVVYHVVAVGKPYKTGDGAEERVIKVTAPGTPFEVEMVCRVKESNSNKSFHIKEPKYGVLAQYLGGWKDGDMKKNGFALNTYEQEFASHRKHDVDTAFARNINTSTGVGSLHAKQMQIQEQAEARERQEEQKRKDALPMLWGEGVGKILAAAIGVYMLCFVFGAFTRGKIISWLVMGVLMVGGLQPPYYILLPCAVAFLFSYPLFFNRWNADEASERFRTWSLWATVACSVYALYDEGFWGILYAAIWVIAWMVAHLWFASHADHAVCKYCRWYAWHERVSERLVHRSTVRKGVSRNDYKGTTVREEGGRTVETDWYERRRGVQVDTWDDYDVFRKCSSCGKIFKASKLVHKSETHW
ncbi:MAG: hypothetical protein LBG30_06585 [Odoribacteraceae bacterium]|jgi:hypothetical protein|nr:hypothetical protein [Odoribacteraceae bacterium]